MLAAPDQRRDGRRGDPWGALDIDTLAPVGAVRLWWVSLDVPAEGDAALRALLTEAERLRADRYPHVARGRRFACGRAALRLVLASLTGGDPRALPFAVNADGKPGLMTSGGVERPPYFNVSHAQDHLLLATCDDGPVGVDLARLEGRLPIDAIAPRFFTPTERLVLDRASDEGERRRRFARLWVRKEAWLKAVGTGISDQLRLIDCSGDLDGAGNGGGRPLVVAGWEVRDVSGLPAGYVASVATPSREGRG